jgi:LmbE family N-acetylglucosaminyl deacetylase
MQLLVNVSTVGHVITTLSFIGVAFYAFMRQKDLHRTTLNSYLIFYAIIGISLVFASINLFRLVHELNEIRETTLTSDLDAIAQYSGIFIQSALILVLFASKIEIKPRPHPACVLAIGAHPDDIEIAAGAALAKMRDAGYGITGLIMTRGEKGGNGDARPVEAERGAKFLGLDSVKVLDFNDTHLSEDIVRITAAIEGMIDKIQPEIIFTHSNHDLHQDHQTVYEATLRAARNTRTTILCYESPSVTQDFHPTYYIDVEKYVDVKVQAMREHYDQRKKSYMKPDLVRGKMAFRGAQAKVEYAEGFEVARMVSSI